MSQYETQYWWIIVIVGWNRFESEDGAKVEESGSQRQVDETAEDVGTADENGFQATGDHLPTSPPMPEHVVKLLADLKAAGVLE